MKKDKQNKELESSDDQIQDSSKLKNSHPISYQQNISANQCRRRSLIQVDQNNNLKYFKYFDAVLNKCLPEQNTFPLHQQKVNFIDHLSKAMGLLQQKMIKQLKQNQFIVTHSPAFDPQQKDNKKMRFNFKVIRYIPSFQVTEILCQLGRYSKKFIVFNSFKANLTHQNCQQLANQGSLSNVYNLQFNCQKYVLKCIQTKGNRKSQFSVILKEIFVASMMSALGLGPRFKRINGFDFCVYDDCVEFAMQFCRPFRCTQQNMEELKFSLFKIHSLKMVHLDIKPQNIGFSSYYQKPVFIDFGLSQLLLYSQGKRTFTSYIGTIEYSGKQMLNLAKELFSQERFGFVDLYGNDIDGLEKSFENLGKVVQNKSQKQKEFNPNETKKDSTSECSNEKSDGRIKSTQIQVKQTRLEIYEQLVQYLRRLVKRLNDKQNFWYNNFQYNETTSIEEQIILTSLKSLVYYNIVLWKEFRIGFQEQIKQINKVLQSNEFLIILSGQLKQFNQLLQGQYFRKNNNIIYQKTIKIHQQQSQSLFCQDTANKISYFYKSQSNKININFHEQISTNHQRLNQQIKYSQPNFNRSDIQVILKNPSKIRQLLFQNNYILYYIKQIVKNLSLTKAYGINISDKKQILKVMNQLKGKDYFKQLIQKQSYEIKYLLGFFYEECQFNDHEICPLPPQNNKNNAFKELFLFYQKLIIMVLKDSRFIKTDDQQEKVREKILSKPNQQKQVDNKENGMQKQGEPSLSWNDFRKQILIPFVFDLIKNSILLGFNYLPWIKKALLTSIYYMISNKNSRKHFVLLIVKKFIEIGVLVQNFQMLRDYNPGEDKIQQNKTFRFDYLNQQLLKLIDYQFLNDFQFESERQKNDIKIKLSQIIPNLWILFHYKLCRIVISLNQIISIFQRIQLQLKNQYLSLGIQQQFQYFDLYQLQIQIIKDLVIMKYLPFKGMSIRNSAQFSINNESYNKLFFSNISKSNKQKEPQSIQLNYFILTNPLTIKLQQAKSEITQLKKIQLFLQKIDQIISAKQLSIFLHFSLRASSAINKSTHQDYENIIHKFIFPFFSQIGTKQTLSTILYQFLDFITMIQKPINYLNDLLTILIDQTTLMVIAIKQRNQFKHSQKKYFLEYYASLLLKIYSVYTLFLKKNFQLNQDNYEQLNQWLQRLKQNMKQFQFLYPESIQIKIINKWTQYKFITLFVELIRKQLSRYEKRSFILPQLIKLTKLLLEKKEKQQQSLIYKQEQKQNFLFNFQTNTISQLIFCSLLPQIIPIDMILDFWKMSNEIIFSKFKSDSDQYIHIFSSINMLKVVFKKYIYSDPLKLLELILNFIEINFDKKQYHIKANNQFELQLKRTTFMVFYNFCQHASQQLTNKVIKETVQIQQRCLNIASIEFLFILLFFHRNYFKQNTKLTRKILLLIAKKLSTSKNYLSKTQYMEQYYLNVLQFEFNLMEDKILNKRNLNRRLRQLMKFIQCYSLFCRKLIKNLIIQYIINTFHANCSKSKISKNSMLKLGQKHYQERIRFTQIELVGFMNDQKSTIKNQKGCIIGKVINRMNNNQFFQLSQQLNFEQKLDKNLNIEFIDIYQQNQQQNKQLSTQKNLENQSINSLIKQNDKLGRNLINYYIKPQFQLKSKKEKNIQYIIENIKKIVTKTTLNNLTQIK